MVTELYLCFFLVYAWEDIKYISPLLRVNTKKATDIALKQVEYLLKHGWKV
jgi:hypothetical protein